MRRGLQRASERAARRYDQGRLAGGEERDVGPAWTVPPASAAGTSRRDTLAFGESPSGRGRPSAGPRGCRGPSEAVRSRRRRFVRLRVRASGAAWGRRRCGRVASQPPLSRRERSAAALKSGKRPRRSPSRRGHPPELSIPELLPDKQSSTCARCGRDFCGRR